MSDTSKKNMALFKALKCPISKGVLGWWSDYCLFKGTLPSMKDLDVFKFPKSLSSLAMFVYDPQKGDYVCRLAGEMVNISHPTHLKNSMLSEVYEKDLACKIRKHWDQAFKIQRALCVTAHIEHPVEELYSWRFILPLYDEAKSGKVILSLSVYDYDAAYYHDRYNNKIYQIHELSADDIERQGA
ncbi:hypothetical protein [Kiloniella litopenaei]|uniref:hypothetical protein n=1 Tax=Kiloniella litopenaei TaxID=1549748 RepID=UPI003BABE944